MESNVIVALTEAVQEPTKLSPLYHKWYADPIKDYPTIEAVVVASELYQTNKLCVQRLYKPISIFI